MVLVLEKIEILSGETGYAILIKLVPGDFSAFNPKRQCIYCLDGVWQDQGKV